MNRGASIDVCNSCCEDYYKHNISLKLKLRHPQVYKDRNFCMLCGVPLLDDDNNSSDFEIKEKYKGNGIKNSSKIYWKIICSLVTVLILVIITYNFRALKKDRSSYNKVDVALELDILKQKYMKQNNVLWQNAWKILNETEEYTHSFILLYKSNNADAAECFAKDLVKVINKIYDKTNIIIYQHRSDIVDYGEELVRYMDLVRRSKHLIVPRLQEMNGETARMFHTLCDDSTHVIKPSYIIFTLEDTSDKIDPNMQKLNPYTRVGMLLRYAWKDLFENELHPLISRIVRNVAEISAVNVTC